MPPREQLRHQQREERRKEESRSASSPQQQTAGRITAEAAGATRQRQGAMTREEVLHTAGRDGARNIQIQWIDVHLPSAKPSRFVVTTAAGNVLEAFMEQKSYRKSYQGTSSLQTDITPVAPHGTTGKLTVHDLTTGEKAEQPWIWRSRSGAGSSSGPGFWELLKRLFT